MIVQVRPDGSASDLGIQSAVYPVPESGTPRSRPIVALVSHTHQRNIERPAGVVLHFRDCDRSPGIEFEPRPHALGRPIPSRNPLQAWRTRKRSDERRPHVPEEPPTLGNGLRAAAGIDTDLHCCCIAHHQGAVRSYPGEAGFHCAITWQPENPGRWAGDVGRGRTDFDGVRREECFESTTVFVETVTQFSGGRPRR